MNKNISQGQILIPFAHYSCLLQDDSAGRTVRELWWTNQKFSSVNIIPPLFTMLIYHMGDEQCSVTPSTSSSSSSSSKLVEDGLIRTCKHKRITPSGGRRTLKWVTEKQLIYIYVSETG
jgi:hypothetical protein